MNNIQAQTQNITIQGYIGKPLSAKSDKSYQSLFVNNRYVKSKLINDAIYEAYHSTLFTTRHPIYVLKISVDPKSIDVNVHPNKMDIKFEQKDIVYKAVNQAIKDTLESNSLIPTDTFKSEQMHFAAPRKDTRILLEQPKYAFEASKQTVFQEKSSTNSINSPKINSSPQEIISNYEQGIQNISQNIVKESSAIYSNTPESNIPESSTQSYNDSIHTHSQINQAATSIASPTAPPTVLETSTENLIQGSHKFPEMKILGQIHKTFFVAETKGGMLLIDQHVVEERVLYEEFMNEYLNKHIQTQTLLKPDILTFTPKQTIIIQNNLEKLKDFGFHLSHFGENDFSLTTTPTILGRTQNKELLEQIIAQLDNFTRQSQKPMHFLQEEIITRMACRASVKAGDTMTIPQITKLLKKLTGCTLPYTCPHGRAIVIKITAEELEKKFLRHG